MKIPTSLHEHLKEWIIEQVDEGIKDYHIHITIDGKHVDYDSISYKGGEIAINIQSPFYMPDTDDLAAVEMLPKDEYISDERAEKLDAEQELEDNLLGGCSQCGGDFVIKKGQHPGFSHCEDHKHKREVA